MPKQDNPIGEVEPKPTKPRASAAKSSLGNLITSVVMAVVATITQVFLARELLPTDRGIYAFLMLTVVFYLPLGSFGLPSSITYFVSTGKYRGTEIGLTSALMGLLHGVLVALALGSLFWADCLGEVASDTPASLIWLTLLLLPMSNFEQSLQRVILGNSYFFLNNLFQLVNRSLTSFALLMAVVFLQKGLWGAIVALLIVRTLMLLGTAIVFVRLYAPKLRIDLAFAQDCYAYGFACWAGDLALRANLRLDQVLLAIFADSRTLGIYSIATTMCETLWMLPDAMGHVLLNRVAGERSSEQRLRLTAQIHRVMFFAIACLGIGMAAIAPWLLPLVFGSEYDGATLPLALMVPGVLALVSTKILAKYFGGVGRPGLNTLALATGATVGLVAYLLLIPRYWLVGAAIASSLSYLASAAMSVRLFRQISSETPTKLFKLNPNDWHWLKTQVRPASAS